MVSDFASDCSRRSHGLGLSWPELGPTGPDIPSDELGVFYPQRSGFHPWPGPLGYAMVVTIAGPGYSDEGWGCCEATSVRPFL